MSNSQPYRYSVAELFCGCGGLSHGFQRTNRFDIVLGNDIKREALQTFRLNHRGEHGVPEILKGDIHHISSQDILAALERKGIKAGELDCLIGGPPCQGFSQARRSEERQNGKIVKFSGYDPLHEDPRNELVLRFLEIAEVLRPRVILIENVPQILRHGHNGQAGKLAENMLIQLRDKMQYQVRVAVLNAADYGVPQLRERAFFLASRDDAVEFPGPTHADPEQANLLSEGLKPWVTVKEAIGDLPDPPLLRDRLGGQGLENYRRVEISKYANSMRSGVSFPYNHLTRKYSPQILSIIEKMQPGETWDYASQRLQDQYEAIIAQNRQIGEARETTITRLASEGIINLAFYKSYYWSAYTRLSWDKPALTITANANFLGSGRFTHPDANRGITMREAARLQTFEDDFRFVTSADDLSDTERIGVGMDMIGEAVPPLLAKAIAEQIALVLDTQREREESVQGGMALSR